MMKYQYTHDHVCEPVNEEFYGMVCPEYEKRIPVPVMLASILRETCPVCGKELEFVGRIGDTGIPQVAEQAEGEEA